MIARTRLGAPQPPKHLRTATKIWFSDVCTHYELEAHHVRLLTLACDAWDRCQQAREVLAKDGLTYLDRWNAPRARPEIAIERDSRIAFARLTRELDLDTDETPEGKRPPALPSNRRH
jgi:phage terminase small subunit